MLRSVVLGNLLMMSGAALAVQVSNRRLGGEEWRLEGDL